YISPVKVFHHFREEVGFVDFNTDKVFFLLFPQNIVTDRVLRLIKNMQGRVEPEVTVNYNSDRIPARPVANVKPGVILLCGSSSHEHAVFLRSPTMDQLATYLVADPFRRATAHKPIRSFCPF